MPTKAKVTYILPDEPTHKLMEQEASGYWRVFDGEKWKFAYGNRQGAYTTACLLNGTHIGFAVWNEKLQVNEYRDVERV